MRWYKNLFYDPSILSSLRTTLIVAVLATLISTIIGTLAAIGIHELRGIKKDVILNINYLPVLNPDIVTAIALMGFFGLFKLSMGYCTMIISHIVFCIPYVILSILPKLNQLDTNTLEAALDLGAKPFYAIRKVIIPQIKPAILTGALMAFTLSIDDFVVSFFQYRTRSNKSFNNNLFHGKKRNKSINKCLINFNAVDFINTSCNYK